MPLESFGSSGNAFERGITYPVRGISRIVRPLPGDAAQNLRREGVVGGTLDTGVHLVGRVGLETLHMTTGIVGYGIGMMRDAVGATLYHTGKIGWGLAKRSPLFPLSSGNRVRDVASEGERANPDHGATRGALSRLGDLWYEERNLPR